MGIDEQLFRQVMSRFASGVSVVTTAYNDQLAGLTVSSFTSLSLEPTLVLICIADHASSHDLIDQAGQFAVNILTEQQADLSVRFAMRDDDKFTKDDYTLSERGLPLLNNTLAHLECTVVNRFPGGDHTIFIGEVVAAQTYSARPLLYYLSRYHALADDETLT